MQAKIIHDHKARFIGSGKKYTINVPVLSGVKLSTLAQNPQGIAFLQAVLGTVDNYETMATTLEFLSGKSRNNILIWTPNQAARARIPKRKAGFDFHQGNFRVSGSGTHRLKASRR